MLLIVSNILQSLFIGNWFTIGSQLVHK